MNRREVLKSLFMTAGMGASTAFGAYVGNKISNHKLAQNPIPVKIDEDQYVLEAGGIGAAVTFLALIFRKILPDPSRPYPTTQINPPPAEIAQPQETAEMH